MILLYNVLNDFIKLLYGNYTWFIWIASADIYSIVETAKANGLDVFKYFELLLTVLPNMKFLTNPDIMEELLPWNGKVKKICLNSK